jgi:hypothetical protein
MKKSFTKKNIKANVAKMVECFPQLNEGLNTLRKTPDKLAENYEKLAYPEHPNWSYCIPISPAHQLKDGRIVDIGIHLDRTWIRAGVDIHYAISANFVYSNDGPDYMSGLISPTCEASKAALIMLRHMDIIDDAYIMDLIGKHNNLLNRFLQSDLTLWDLSKFVGDK